MSDHLGEGVCVLVILFREVYLDSWAAQKTHLSHGSVSGHDFSVGRISRAVCSSLITFSCQVQVESR